MMYTLYDIRLLCISSERINQSLCLLDCSQANCINTLVVYSQSLTLRTKTKSRFVSNAMCPVDADDRDWIKQCGKHNN